MSFCFKTTNVIEHSWLMVNFVRIVCCFVLLSLMFVCVRLCVFFKRTRARTENKNRHLRTTKTGANTSNTKQPQLIHAVACLSFVGVRCSFYFFCDLFLQSWFLGVVVVRVEFVFLGGRAVCVVYCGWFVVVCVL